MGDVEEHDTHGDFHMLGITTYIHLVVQSRVGRCRLIYLSGIYFWLVSDGFTDFRSTKSW